MTFTTVTERKNKACQISTEASKQLRTELQERKGYNKQEQILRKTSLMHHFGSLSIVEHEGIIFCEAIRPLQTCLRSPNHAVRLP